MDFSVIFQLRTKKFWWMNVIFYFVVSLLISTVFCYLIFLTKNYFQRKDINKEIIALQTVGTDTQKQEEDKVLTYQLKIKDFSILLQNHEFASNVFAFLQAESIPNIWFKQFTLDQKNSQVQLSGESDDLDAFSRQVAVFERNKYVKNITTFNSASGDMARIKFNIDMTLDPEIFNYLFNVASMGDTVTTPEQTPVQ